MNPTLVAIYAAIVSTLSLAVSGLSVTWSYISWRLTAGRAQVAVFTGAVLADGRTYVLADIPRSGRIDQVGKNNPEVMRGSTLAVFVRVTNQGRLPLTVKAVRFGAGLSELLTVGKPDYGKPFPAVIPPYDHEEFGYRQDAIVGFAAHARRLRPTRWWARVVWKIRPSRTVRLRPTVFLGAGKPAKGKRAIRL